MSESPERISISTDSPSKSVLEALSDLIPGAIQDGVIDVQRLAELSGLEVAGVKNGPERFGLMWAGKSKAVEALQAPSMAALVPDTENSINWDTAENVFIEGDNLEVLKLLQKAYNDQVKLIYIDPPYNTGNDFVYNDDFSEPLKHYLEVTGQVDSDGNRLVANTEVSGRKHSNWLSMMYPRLVLARNVLSKTGAIVVSIDDNEVHNLRAIMDEIFGSNNFVAQFVWQSRPSVQNDTDISSSHEYLLMYARNRRMQNRRLKASNAEAWFSDDTFAVYPKLTDSGRYTRDDNDGRGPFKEDPFDAPNVRPNLTYIIKNPKTGEEFLPPTGRHWRTTPSEYERLLLENRISWGTTGTGRPKLKSYYNENSAYGEVPNTWLSSDHVGSSTAGTREMQELFDGKVPFDTAKPTKLLRHLLSLAVRDDGIVLDFFAGSGSLGHAIFLENADKGLSNKFVLVNIAEATPENSSAWSQGLETISDITRARLRKVIDNIPTARVQGLRCFRLGPSNFVSSVESAGSELLSLVDQTLKPNSVGESIVAEALLKVGVRLDRDWVRIQISGQDAIVSAGTCVVLARALNNEITREASELADVHTVIFLEDAFSGRDAVKANAHFALKQANKTMKTI